MKDEDAAEAEPAGEDAPLGDGEEAPAEADPEAEAASAPDEQSDEPERATRTKRGTARRAPDSGAPAADVAVVETRVAALLDAADGLAKRGEKAAALTRYTDAFRAAGDRSRIRDVALRKRLGTALASRAKLIGQLRDGGGMRKMTLDALMSDGARALQEGKWEAALDSLHDARTVVEDQAKLPTERLADPHYVPALHGMAVAYLKLNRNPKAGELFDDKSPLGRASLGASPDREMVWNRAVIDLIQKYKVMRAVKGLAEYLERNPEANDEGVMNLLGTAIYTAYHQFDDDKKPPPLLVQATALYEKRERQLESGRMGEKRWGVDWISADEFNRKMTLTREIEARVQRLRTNDLARARRDLAVAKRGRRVRVGGWVKYIVDQQQVRSAQNRVDRALEQIREERANIPQRNWLARYEPIVPDIAPPQTALASAAPRDSGDAGADGGDGAGEAALADEPEPLEPDEPGPSVAEAIPPRGAASKRAEPDAPRAAAAAAPVRRVQRYAAAFAVDRFRLITAAAPLGEAATVFIEDSQGGGMPARVVARDERLALLEVDPGSINGGMPYLNLSDDFAGGTIRCAGLPSPSLFAPVVEMVEGRGARPPAAGDAAPWTVSLSRHPRLAGVPLLDAASNALVGILLAERDDPATQLPAVGVAAIRAFLSEHDALPPARSGNPDPTGVYQVTIEE